MFPDCGFGFSFHRCTFMLMLNSPAFHQFTCSRERLEDCVANELNASSVTNCLLHNLTKTAADGVTLCSSQAMACHFPEVSPSTSQHF